MFGLLKRLTAPLQQYLWIGLVATTLAATTFAYLYKEALQDIARVKAEAVAEALEAANIRQANVLARQKVATDAREADLLARIDQLNAETGFASARAEEAELALRHYVTEQQNDEASAEWQETELPSSVVSRLQGLAAEPAE
jgi:hypothetical protein